MKKYKIFMRTKNGEVQMKSPVEKDFIRLYDCYVGKNIDQAIILLKKLPANKDAKFIKVN